MIRDLINWQYCYDPNDINKAIINLDSDWERIMKAEDFIGSDFIFYFRKKEKE